VQHEFNLQERADATSRYPTSQSPSFGAGARRTNGECSLVTDNGRLVAMVGPPPQDPIESKDSSSPTEESKPLSDAAEFRKALFGVPSPIELDF
jgi:hypothetical protein